MVVSPFIETFPSDRISKEKKNYDVQFSKTAEIPVNYSGQLRGLFEATYLPRLVIFLEPIA